ncbi:CoA ester lyase [Psychromarinibacter sp. C21-152]|uniref:CoA ester lyase n=1 Tax=Psychromarinibacter sediminicola TaxID=3033385 RepID=A0AAE3NNL6_9RHOB|nr:CoA ester lyase [Psychromarinibacter sediminicola]MDF0599142.1 CoA ester lyase [Psychromarinibacter sediminicola]
MRDPRSYLFVPGNRPDRFAKAAAAGADALILDLEDAVGPSEKDDARVSVRRWFEGGGAGLVRVNGTDTPWFADDVAALAELGPAAVMVPKADRASLALAARKLPGRALLALVETVAGLAELREAARMPGVARLAFGNLDFGTDARVPPESPVLDAARVELALASRLADLPPPVDGVTMALKDDAVLRADIQRACLSGFSAKLCIHPAQVEPVNSGFLPSADELDWARRVLAALQTAGGSVVQLDGKMVDKPLIERAERIVAAMPDEPVPQPGLG